ELRRREGDREIRLDVRADQVGATTRKTARNVDGDDRPAGAREPLREIRREPFERAAEPGAVERVDDQVRPGRRGERRLEVAGREIADRQIEPAADRELRSR